MAQQFLDSLPKVDAQMQSAESKCMICMDVYGTKTEEGGTNEPAVYLPCGHDVGAKCIEKWMTSESEARNTCPACRTTFFPAQPCPYLGPYLEFETLQEERDEEEDDGQEVWNGTRRRAIPGAFFLDVLRLVGEAGQPPEEEQEHLRREEEESNAHRQIRAWWPEFFRTTTEQYLDSIRRSREIVTTPRTPPPGADMNSWSPYPHLEYYASEPIHPEEVDPRYLEHAVRVLATAFRTLSFREALAYSILRDTGAEARLPVPPEDDLRPGSAEQEEAMFLEMERRGAFAEYDSGHQYSGLSNRERWRVYREEYGQCWNPDTRRWSPDWSA